MTMERPNILVISDNVILNYELLQKLPYQQFNSFAVTRSMDAYKLLGIAKDLKVDLIIIGDCVETSIESVSAVQVASMFDKPFGRVVLYKNKVQAKQQGLFCIDIANETDKLVDTIHKAIEHAKKQQATTQKKLILYAHSSGDILKTIKALVKGNYEFIYAGDIEDIVRTYEEFPIDFLIMGNRFEGASGMGDVLIRRLMEIKKVPYGRVSSLPHEVDEGLQGEFLLKIGIDPHFFTNMRIHLERLLTG